MATIAAQLTVATSALLLFQTTTGVSPDVPVDQDAQQFQAGTFNDPVPIIVENTDGTAAVWLGGSGVTANTGLLLAAGESVTYNVVGSDSLYAISAGSVVVAVSAGRQ